MALSEPMYARDWGKASGQRKLLRCTSHSQEPSRRGEEEEESEPYTLVSIREGLNVASADDGVGEAVKLSGLRSSGLGRVELAEKLLLLLNLLEDASEVLALLGCDLSGRGVVGGSAVTEGEDAVGTEEAEVLVDEETATGVLLRADAGHEVLSDGTSGVTSGPTYES